MHKTLLFFKGIIDTIGKLLLLRGNRMCKTYCKPKLKFKIFPLNTKQNKNMKKRLINKGKVKPVEPASW